MKLAGMVAGVLVPMVGASFGAVPGALNDDVVVAGRISSVQEASYFKGDEEYVTYILKVRPLFHPGVEIEFVAHDPRCPLRAVNDRVYLLFLNDALTVQDPKVTGDPGRKMLEVFRCVALDAKNSIGFIEEKKAEPLH